MNKKILIIVCVLALLGLGAYFIFGATSPNVPFSPSENSSAAQSLKELILGGQKVTCTFSDTSDGSNTSGTIIVSNQKMRGDFETKENSQSQKAHMIINNNTNYTWLDGQKDGYKMSFNPADSQTAPNNTPDKNQNLDLDKKADYKCSPWSGSDDAFQLPAGINFVDLADLTKQIPAIAPVPNTNNQQTGNNPQCAACDSLPNEAKVQCRVALSCK